MAFIAVDKMEMLLASGEVFPIGSMNRMDIGNFNKSWGQAIEEKRFLNISGHTGVKDHWVNPYQIVSLRRASK